MPDVLIVQSDTSIRTLLRATLELEGYTCEEAEDGISAWNLLRRCERACVVLLSDMLPDLGWHDLLLVVARDTCGAGRHAYVVTTALAERRQPEIASVPMQLAVSLLPLPTAISALPRIVARAARRIGLQIPGRVSRVSRVPKRAARALTLRLAAASAGPDATIDVRTCPGAALAVEVRYPSGRTARSPELRGSRVADARGRWQWKWRPRTATVGSATVLVTAEWNGQRVELATRIALAPRPRKDPGRQPAHIAP